MVLFDWKVNSLCTSDNKEFKNIVTFVSFTVSGNLEDKTHSVSYSINLLPPKKKSDFRAFDSLTENDVIEWTKESLNQPGKIGVAGIEAEITQSLMGTQEVLEKVKELPWTEKESLAAADTN